MLLEINCFTSVYQYHMPVNIVNVDESEAFIAYKL